MPSSPVGLVPREATKRTSGDMARMMAFGKQHVALVQVVNDALDVMADLRALEALEGIADRRVRCVRCRPPGRCRRL